MNEPNNKAEPLMRVSDLSEYLGMSEGTIRNRVSAGTIPYLKAGGLVRFRRSAIDDWLQEQTAKSNSDSN